MIRLLYPLKSNNNKELSLFWFHVNTLYSSCLSSYPHVHIKPVSSKNGFSWSQLWKHTSTCYLLNHSWLFHFLPDDELTHVLTTVNITSMKRLCTRKHWRCSWAVLMVSKRYSEILQISFYQVKMITRVNSIPSNDSSILEENTIDQVRFAQLLCYLWLSWLSINCQTRNLS